MAGDMYIKRNIIFSDEEINKEIDYIIKQIHEQFNDNKIEKSITINGDGTKHTLSFNKVGILKIYNKEIL